jgi:hypothetical protein
MNLDQPLHRDEVDPPPNPIPLRARPAVAYILSQRASEITGAFASALLIRFAGVLLKNHMLFGALE